MLNWNHDNIPILLPGCGGFVSWFFSGPLHLLKQHLFQGPEGKGARRSGWPEPYQGHITIGRFNKKGNLLEAAISFSCLVQNWFHSTGVHSNYEILNLEQQYNFPRLRGGFNPEHCETTRMVIIKPQVSYLKFTPSFQTIFNFPFCSLVLQTLVETPGQTSNHRKILYYWCF